MTGRLVQHDRRLARLVYRGPAGGLAMTHAYLWLLPIIAGALGALAFPFAAVTVYGAYRFVRFIVGDDNAGK